jgi:hypothetical protein
MHAILVVHSHIINEKSSRKILLFVGYCIADHIYRHNRRPLKVSKHIARNT